MLCLILFSLLRITIPLLAMLHQNPIPIKLPHWGIAFIESRHHPDFSMPERSDPFHKILLVNEGSTVLCSPERDPLSLREGHICCIPSSISHLLEDRQPASLLILCLSNEFTGFLPAFRPVWEEALSLSLKPIKPSGLIEHRLDALWRRGIGVQEAPLQEQPLLHQLLAMEIVATIVRASKYPKKDDPRQRIRQFLEQLETDFHEAWNVDRAAAMVQLPRRRFSDYFREITGQSFVEKLTSIRLEKARKLMRIREYSIAGASFSAGFNDLSHFYRTFRKQMGITPGEWLRQSLSDQAGREDSRSQRADRSNPPKG